MSARRKNGVFFADSVGFKVSFVLILVLPKVAPMQKTTCSEYILFYPS